MRENCLYGSEGGGDRHNRPFLPLSYRPPWIPAFAGMTDPRGYRQYNWRSSSIVGRPDFTPTPRRSKTESSNTERMVRIAPRPLSVLRFSPSFPRAGFAIFWLGRVFPLSRTFAGEGRVRVPEQRMPCRSTRFLEFCSDPSPSSSPRRSAGRGED
jgi:hypothetical protein